MWVLICNSTSCRKHKQEIGFILLFKRDSEQLHYWIPIILTVRLSDTPISSLVIRWIQRQDRNTTFILLALFHSIFNVKWNASRLKVDSALKPFSIKSFVHICTSIEDYQCTGSLWLYKVFWHLSAYCFGLLVHNFTVLAHCPSSCVVFIQYTQLLSKKALKWMLHYLSNTRQ